MQTERKYFLLDLYPIFTINAPYDSGYVPSQVTLDKTASALLLESSTYYEKKYYPFVLVAEGHIEKNEYGKDIWRADKVFEFFSKREFQNNGQGRYVFPSINSPFKRTFCLGYQSRAWHSSEQSSASILEKINPYLQNSEQMATIFNNFFNTYVNECQAVFDKWKNDKMQRELKEKNASNKLDNILSQGSVTSNTSVNRQTVKINTTTSSNLTKSSNKSSKTKKKTPAQKSNLSLYWLSAILPFLMTLICYWCSSKWYLLAILFIAAAIGFYYSCDDIDSPLTITLGIVGGFVASVIYLIKRTISLPFLVAIVFSLALAIFAFIKTKNENTKK